MATAASPRAVPKLFSYRYPQSAAAGRNPGTGAEITRMGGSLISNINETKASFVTGISNGIHNTALNLAVLCVLLLFVMTATEIDAYIHGFSIYSVWHWMTIGSITVIAVYLNSLLNAQYVGARVFSPNGIQYSLSAEEE